MIEPERVEEHPHPTLPDDEPIDAPAGGTSTGETTGGGPAGAFDRDALIEAVSERLAAIDGIDNAAGGRFDGKMVGADFRDLLLADMYATLYEFRLTIDALQKGGASGLLGAFLGGGGRRRRRGKGGDDGEG